METEENELETVENQRRRQRLLNIVLIFVITVFVLLLTVIVYERIILGPIYRGVPFQWLLLIILVLSGLWRANKRGHTAVAAYLFLGIYFVATAYGTYQWGASLPIGLLSYAFFITMAGIIVGGRFGLWATVLSVATLGWFGWQEYQRGMLPAWKTVNVRLEDVVAYCVMIGLAAFFSWLSNREMEKSLARALVSEAELKNERDNLEVNLERRTRAWKEAELAHSVELARFAEFGKLSAGLFHDLISPLTNISLSLQNLEKETNGLPAHRQAKTFIDTALRSAHRLQAHISRARKHMKVEHHKRSFRVEDELKDIIKVLEYQARERAVQVELAISLPIILYGNPIKFYQLSSNLIVNSLEAYRHQTNNKPWRIIISARETENGYEVSFSDNASGMSPDVTDKIFVPFFTTKDSGVGLGLSIVKEIAEGHFGGTVRCESTLGVGTTFILFFPFASESSIYDSHSRSSSDAEPPVATEAAAS